MQTEDIRIRDPFVFEWRGSYYLYGTTDRNVWEGKAEGFMAYRSRNLRSWEGPYRVFLPPQNFWSDQNYWAPEVYRYNGRFCMFASFKSASSHRRSQALWADSPLGPFTPAGGPFTPAGWDCLDATLYVDENGVPWTVFCREWLQVGDGEIWAARLTSGFEGILGRPQRLFHASEASWVVPVQGRAGCYVTDGPFLYSCIDGSLLLLWSSYSRGGYAIGQARSVNGILGPWVQIEEPLLEQDGGHGMLFRTKDRLLMAIHMPNTTPLERLGFLPVSENSGQLRPNGGSLGRD